MIRAGADSAWKALFTEGELEAGQTVLIHAAAGGVGQFAVQLAKWKGATVIGTASTANLDFVKSLGLDQVIDTTTLFEEVVKDVDLVIDSVGGDTHDNLQTIVQLIAAGTIKARIDSIFPLSEVKEAHKQSESRHGHGRILLRVNSN